MAVSRDLDEYSQKVEGFGQDYGGNMEEIRLEMSKRQEDIEKEKSKK